MSDLFRTIKEADVVSLEVVGTLLVRGVCRPVDVWRLTQERFNAHSGRYLTDELAPHRLTAESALYDEADRTGGAAGPVTLDAIYRRVGATMQLDPAMTDLLHRAELDAERRMLRADPALLELVLFAADQGKQIVGVGDTCLPAPFLAEVLAGEGVAPPLELLVSSRTGGSITEDGVWEELERRFPGRAVVHVGSDPAAVAAARRHGVGVVEVTTAIDAYRRRIGPAAALDGPLVFQHLGIDGFRLKNLHRSMLNALVAGRLSGADDLPVPYVLGYGALGPFMTAFVQWLHREAGRWGCDGFRAGPVDGPFVAEAYRSWWGHSALPFRSPTTGAGGPAGGAPVEPAAVGSGWNAASGRWDGHLTGLAHDPPPSVCLAVGIDPAAASGGPVPPTEAFVDGRIAAQRSLFDDLLGAPGAFLQGALGTAAKPSAPAELLEAVRRGALDFVAQFRAVTDGLPSTVANVDRRTACENLVMVLNAPPPPAVEVLARFTPAETSHSPAGRGDRSR